MNSLSIHSTKLLSLVTVFAACTFPLTYSWQTVCAHSVSPNTDLTNKQIEVFSKAQGVSASKRPSRLIKQGANYQIAGYTSTSTPLAGYAATPPSVAVFNNQLVAFITGLGYDSILYRRMYSNWSWDDRWFRIPGKFRFMSRGSVQSVAVFNNRLVALATGLDGKIYVTQTDSNWR